MAPPIATVRLVGPAGEPVDLRRTLSWAWADLPPLRLDAAVPSLTVTLPVARGRPRIVIVGPGGDDHAELRVRGRTPASATVDGLVAAVRSMLRLDEDLTPFYAVAAGDPDLSWAVRGAGRLTRSPTVFQDVVNTSLRVSYTKRHGHHAQGPIRRPVLPDLPRSRGRGARRRAPGEALP